jgi:hypothetical protein
LTALAVCRGRHADGEITVEIQLPVEFDRLYVPNQHLTATVTATPTDACGHGSTIKHDDLATRLRTITQWTPADALNHSFAELQNRWSASPAMSTDGSFPSQPRQFLNTNLIAGHRN